jgi:hypothetical protein
MQLTESGFRGTNACVPRFFQRRLEFPLFRWLGFRTPRLRHRKHFTSLGMTWGRSANNAPADHFREGLRVLKDPVIQHVSFFQALLELAITLE